MLKAGASAPLGLEYIIRVVDKLLGVIWFKNKLYRNCNIRINDAGIVMQRLLFIEPLVHCVKNCIYSI